MTEIDRHIDGSTMSYLAVDSVVPRCSAVCVLFTASFHAKGVNLARACC